MAQLKPLSDFERGLLKALGQSPENHQKEVLFTKTISESMSTKRREPTARERLNKVNRHFERKIAYVDPADVAARRAEALAEARPKEPVLLPQAYVIFIRQWHCDTCSAEGTCMDINQIFIEYALQGKDPSARVFKPTTLFKETMPHRRIVNFVNTPFCHLCFGHSPIGENQCKNQEAAESAKSMAKPSVLNTQASSQATKSSPSIPQDTTILHSLEAKEDGSASILMELLQDTKSGSDQKPSENPYQGWWKEPLVISEPETTSESLQLVAILSCTFPFLTPQSGSQDPTKKE